MRNLIALCLFSLCILPACQSESGILIEAESFTQKGGWIVDPQFVEQMGSPYLMAHGMGEPVVDAITLIDITESGQYNIWLRTMNWAPGNWEAPGQFAIAIENELLPVTLGQSDSWSWVKAGEMHLDQGENTLRLVDKTGFNGRCDAIWISQNQSAPPSKKDELNRWRKKRLGSLDTPETVKNYDLVIVGGGIAGCAAAISAAEHGLQVALVHDRPVLGGNASSEIRVHTLGIYGKFERILKKLDTKHYPNGSPEAYEDDEKRHRNIEGYKNIKLFLNWRAYSTVTKNHKITSVDVRETSTGEQLRFEAPYFIDCTGDGWIGYWSGAEYFYGRESANTYGEGWDKYGETWSPKVADNAVMGASVLWRTCSDDTISIFPSVPWALEVAGSHAARKGTWNWEFISQDYHQIDDAETIRDHMLKAIIGSFYNEKQKPGNENLKLEWMSHLLGKRESRRLVGDHIYTFNDARENREFADSVVVEIREVDVHYPQNILNESIPDFLTDAMFYNTGRYYIPYRSLYSKDIENLFMAGRCFSCSHIGLGGPRVMLTTGQMGAAVGIAASLCIKYKATPRDIYDEHLEEYWKLILAQQ
ncbi:MAG: FAD-dependent oxidoreductase [Bacteroidales bacterium]|nr:FAD-dependent oxidoreductase [Bacteroidales bacterium]